MKLLWSREEDMTQGRCHPVMKAKLTQSLDADGNLQRHCRSPCRGRSITAAVQAKDLESVKDREVPGASTRADGDTTCTASRTSRSTTSCTQHTRATPGWWRGVNTHHNAIFLDCFIDELAHAAGEINSRIPPQAMADHPQNIAVL